MGTVAPAALAGAPDAAPDPRRGAPPTLRTLVLVPSYNEEENLPRVLAGIRAHAPAGTDVLVVDDCSGDRTSEVARGGGAIVARHPVNLGYGAALLTGYRFADRRGYDRLVQLDGDGQHDPAGIPVLLAGLEQGADLVLGSRFAPGARPYQAGIVRGIGMRLFRAIATAALHQTVTDPTSGFQALSQRLVRFHAGGEHFPSDYPDADVLILVARAGFRIREVPVTMYEKPGGASMHSGLAPLYYVAKMLLSIVLVLSTARSAPGGDRRDSTPEKEGT